MTTLDWNIYNYLKEQAEKGEWTKMKALADKFNISTRELRKSITRIRKDETIQKVIVSDYSKGYKILTSADEETNYIERKRIKALKELKQVALDIKRINLNGQTKLVFGTKERDFIESLV